MSDKGFVLYCTKMKLNPLLARKQCVSTASYVSETRAVMGFALILQKPTNLLSFIVHPTPSSRNG